MEPLSISVKVHPNAKKNLLVQTGPNRFEAWVKARPVAGRANEELYGLLVSQLKISRQNIRMVKGRNRMNKVFRIFG